MQAAHKGFPGAAVRRRRRAQGAQAQAAAHCCDRRTPRPVTTSGGTSTGRHAPPARRPSRRRRDAPFRPPAKRPPARSRCCWRWPCAATRRSACAARRRRLRCARRRRVPWAPVATPAGASWAVHDVTCVGSAEPRARRRRPRRRLPGRRPHVEGRRAERPRRHRLHRRGLHTGGRGVLASGGLLLVTADWGATWAPPAFAGPGPTSAVTDVVMRGASAVAVGDGRHDPQPAATPAPPGSQEPRRSPRTSRAWRSPRTARRVAGSAAGDVLVRTTAWAVAGAAGAPVTSVAAVATPVWGDGQPDLFAATEHDVLGSDDALAFASLPGLPDLSAAPGAPWPGPASPDRSLLVAGSAGAGYFGPAGAWVSGATGLDGLVARRRTRRPERRLPAGRGRPAAPHAQRRPHARRRLARQEPPRPRRRLRALRHRACGGAGHAPAALARARPLLDHAAHRPLDHRRLGRSRPLRPRDPRSRTTTRSSSSTAAPPPGSRPSPR